jgi:hypothetical protein
MTSSTLTPQASTTSGLHGWGQRHKKLDAAVFAAYGWPVDLSDDEILARLLALNLERAGK